MGKMPLKHKIAEALYTHLPYEKTEKLTYVDCMEVAEYLLDLINKEVFSNVISERTSANESRP